MLVNTMLPYNNILSSLPTIQPLIVPYPYYNHNGPINEKQNIKLPSISYILGPKQNTQFPSLQIAPSFTNPMNTMISQPIQPNHLSNLNGPTRAVSIPVSNHTINPIPNYIPDPSHIGPYNPSFYPSLNKPLNSTLDLHSNAPFNPSSNFYPPQELKEKFSTETKVVSTLKEKSIPIQKNTSSSQRIPNLIKKVRSSISKDHTKKFEKRQKFKKHARSPSQDVYKNKIYDLQSSEFKIKPPRLFPNFEIDSDFIYKNLRRDYKYGSLNKDYRFDFTKPENEITLKQNDFIRWKVYDFFLDYLKMYDVRQKKSIENLTSLDIENLFHINLSFYLKSPQDSSKNRKVSIKLKVIKPSQSTLTKAKILEAIETNLDELFLNYQTEDDKKFGINHRKISKKPRWGLGYEDELSVICLDVAVLRAKESINFLI